MYKDKRQLLINILEKYKELFTLELDRAKKETQEKFNNIK